MGRYEQEIASAVALRGTIPVAELARMLGVSDQTVRRIVRPMVAAGTVEKVHGAIRARTNPMAAPFLARMEVNRAAKARIAAHVAALIPDGASVAIDTGSTAGFVAQALRPRRDLTVVTNSAYVAATLAMVPGNRVFMAGSQLRDHDGAAFDRAAFATVERMRTGFAVLTAGQVHPARGVLVAEACEAEMEQAMAAIATRVILAVDHSKFTGGDSAGMVALGALPARALLVTDAAPGPEFAGLDRGFDLEIAR